QARNASNTTLFLAVIGRESKEWITLQEMRELNAFDFDFRITKEFRIDVSNSNVTDDELERIIEQFPNIIEIKADGCPFLTDAGLAHLLNLASLTRLDLSYCSRISDTGLAN